MNSASAAPIPLRCPTCGSTINHSLEELRFGLKFTCTHCGVTSVLINTRELYTPRPGEHVCSSCGSVSAPNDRYCQCGQSLVRVCTNQDCLKEIASDHQRCEYCGWLQQVPRDHQDSLGTRLALARAGLESPNQEDRSRAVRDFLYLALDGCDESLDRIQRFLLDPTEAIYGELLCGSIALMVWNHEGRAEHQERLDKRPFPETLLRGIIKFSIRTSEEVLINHSRTPQGALEELAKKQPQGFSEELIELMVNNELECMLKEKSGIDAKRIFLGPILDLGPPARPLFERARKQREYKKIRYEIESYCDSLRFPRMH